MIVSRVGFTHLAWEIINIALFSNSIHRVDRYRLDTYTLPRCKISFVLYAILSNVKYREDSLYLSKSLANRRAINFMQ